MTTVAIGKSKFGQQDVDELRHCSAKKHRKTVARMAAGGWFSPPISPEKIPKYFSVFKTKKHRTAKLIYIILIARSNELGGITKISNSAIAHALKSRFKYKISGRQISRALSFLQENRLIGRLINFRPPKNIPYGADRSQFKPGYFKPKTDRMFIVWATFFVNKCRPKRPGWSGLNSDPRVECEEWENVIKKIPLKYRISKPIEFIKDDGSIKSIIPDNCSWDDLYRLEVLDSEIYFQVLALTEAKAEGFHAAVVDVMGRSESRMYYLANKEKIEQKRAKKNFEKKEYLKNLKKSYDIE